MFATKYFMPGCGHCKEMEEAWNKIKELFGDSVKEVDCTKEQEVCTTEQIQGVPTVRYSVGNTKFDHVGERSFDAIKASVDMLQFLAPAVEEPAVEEPAVDQNDTDNVVSTSFLKSLYKKLKRKTPKDDFIVKACDSC